MNLRFVKLLSLAALALPLAACGGNQGGDVLNDFVAPDEYKNITIQVWDSISGQDGTAYGEMIDEFNNEFAGQIYAKRIPNATSTDYYNNAEMAISQGSATAPDVIQTGNDIVPQWGYQGNILVPLSPIFEAIGEPIDASDYDSNILASASWDGEIIELPMGMHGTVLYVNENVWNQYFPDEEEPEWTRENVMKYGAKVYELSGGTVYGLPMSNAFPGNTYGQFDAFYQNGGRFTSGSEDWTVGFDTAEGVKGVQSFTDIILHADKWGGSAQQIGNDVDLNWFMDNKALFCVDGTWCLPNLYSAEETTSKLQWHAAPISGLYAEDPTAEYADSILVQSHNFGITQSCATDNDKACAAAVFIDWMTKNCLKYCDAGHIAARKSVRETEEYKALPHHSEFGDSANFVLNESNPAVLHMQTEYSLAVGEIMSGGSNDETTVKASLDSHKEKAEDRIETWLASY